MNKKTIFIIVGTILALAAIWVAVDQSKYYFTGDKNFCDDEMRYETICESNYRPVCGWYQKEIECLDKPCAATFDNGCLACNNQYVDYWTEGNCPN